MKKIIIIILSIFLMSCGDTQETLNSYGKFPYRTTDQITVVVIDSCEYLVCNGQSGGPAFTHKGNCKHCKQIK